MDQVLQVVYDLIVVCCLMILTDMARRTNHTSSNDNSIFNFQDAVCNETADCEDAIFPSWSTITQISSVMGNAS